MTALTAAAVGAAFGIGLLVVVRAWWPSPPALARTLAGFDRPGHPITATTPTPSSVLASLTRRVIAVVDTTGLVNTPVLQGRLRTLGVSVEAHTTRKLALALGGATLPLLIAGMAAVAGVGVSVGWVTAGVLAGAAVGFILPDIGLADQVEVRRREFRYALSAYLDLVTVILAGGGGLETALQAAADAGDGWAFNELRIALAQARMAATSPWDAFDHLGTELDIDDLRELAAAARLAGDHGARIRASLTAKADTLRANLTTLSEAQAEAATEKMLIPAVGLVVGMVLFIGFGAVSAIGTPTSLTP